METKELRALKVLRENSVKKAKKALEKKVIRAAMETKGLKDRKVTKVPREK
jgi:hypothetical protein